MTLRTTTKGSAVRFEVRARPNAKRTMLREVRDGIAVIDVGAAPRDGAANEELVRFFAETLGVPRRDVSIVRGASGRTKLVEVIGLDERSVSDRIHR